MGSILQVKRGSDSGRLDKTFAEGEPIYTIDTKKLFVGDGRTPGGIEIGGGVFQIATVIDEEVAGQYNSINRDYTLAHDFLANTVEIKLNGLPQKEGEENDYILIWPRTVRMNDAPFLGDSVTASYKTQIPTP